MNRRKLRECTFEILFRVNYHDTADMNVQTGYYLDNTDIELTEEEKAEISAHVDEIVPKLSEIDDIISENAVNWTLKRMNLVDLTILRLAVYEMKFDESVPVKVAINEAVELAKQYGESNSPSFVNGVLARILKKENDEK